MEIKHENISLNPGPGPLIRKPYLNRVVLGVVQQGVFSTRVVSYLRLGLGVPGSGFKVQDFSIVGVRFGRLGLEGVWFGRLGLEGGSQVVMLWCLEFGTWGLEFGVWGLGIGLLGIEAGKVAILLDGEQRGRSLE